MSMQAVYERNMRKNTRAKLVWDVRGFSATDKTMNMHIGACECSKYKVFLFFYWVNFNEDA